MTEVKSDAPRLLSDDGRLVCSRCPACSLVAFPAERYGCERCGAATDALERIEVESTGVVTSASLVHRHHDPKLAAPFVVVAVALDAGPAIKGVLAADPAADLAGAEPTTPAIGTRVHGTSVEGQFRFERDR